MVTAQFLYIQCIAYQPFKKDPTESLYNSLKRGFDQISAPAYRVPEKARSISIEALHVLYVASLDPQG